MDLCSPMCIKSINGKKYILVIVDDYLSLGPELQLMTPGSICTGLLQNPSSSTPYVPPTKKDWDILFQPMFDEYFQSSPSVVSRVPLVAAPIPADITGTPSSTLIDQDAQLQQ
ncbi:hypothetical protein Tco_0960741 [Tanacetum coccineum]